jgi:SOS-response transcriptional repressor LexA
MNSIDLFAWIVQYKSLHDGNSPTTREMMIGCELRSTSVVAWHLSRLEKEGKIRRELDRARGIYVVGGKWSYVP